MSSIEESKRQVTAGLKQHCEEIDHDAILASLQDEIDKHNLASTDIKDEVECQDEVNFGGAPRSPSPRPRKFRFKDGISDPRKRKHRSHGDRNRRKHHRREKGSGHPSKLIDSASVNGEAAHPFPREPVDPGHDGHDSNAAFRESLFDALADDEGAAYWENVYSQPIHIYDRPSVENAKGELEQMDDEEYAAYVQTKMWERKHPEILRERKKRERQKRLEEEELAHRRAEFVRRKERAAWEKAQRWTGDDGEEEGESQPRQSRRNKYEFTGETNMGPEHDEEDAEYAVAWSNYLRGWEQLKQDLLAALNDAVATSGSAKAKPSARLPWPVLPYKPVTKPNIEQFIRNAPSDADHPKLRILKAERVRWHPDKIQQRFGGKVEEGTMKVVTGVFQVIDGLVEEERKRSGS